MGTKAKKARRKRSPHPGVIVVKRKLPSGAVRWQARYFDPQEEKTMRPMLDASLTTEEARREWAIGKSEELRQLNRDIKTGVVAKVDPQSIDGAIKEYLADARHRLRANTVDRAYAPAIEKFREWCAKHGIRRTTDLTPVRLVAFRAYLVAKPRQNIVADGRRGERADSTKRRAPGAVNVELRSIKSMLNRWRLADLVLVPKDKIADALKSERLNRERPAFLTPADCQRLLDACIRHDQETFAETRNEHAGHGTKGTTPRYEPIAPFVAFLLLSGCRIGEALSLKWPSVDLDALDNEARKVGEIHLDAADVKTGRARTLGLEVSPGLRRMLAGMALRAGDDAYVFGGSAPLPRTAVEGARKRLTGDFGAPRFSWQNLRQTAATYLVNAPGIFGSATIYRSCAQLGHSVQVAERLYVGLMRGIPREAHSLEAAMQVETQLETIVGRRAQAAPALHMVGA